jgi:spore germination protein KB
MSKRKVRGSVAMLLLLYMGSGNALGRSLGLGADTWIAYLLGLLLAAPLLLVLARLVQLTPGMDLYDMLDYTLGRRLAAIAAALYFFYFIALAATVGVRYGAFLQFTSLTHTPLIVILLALFAVCAYLAGSGVETLGKWSTLWAATALLAAVLLTLLAIPSMRLENLLPIAASGGGAIFRGGHRITRLPFGEAVVLLALLGHLDRRANPYRLFFLGATLAAGFFVLTFLRDAAVLGAGNMDSLRYPHFQAAGVLQVGAGMTRIESLASIPPVITGLTKAAVCLLAAAGALRRIFGLAHGGLVLIPLALFCVGLSMMLFDKRAALFAYPAVHLRIAPLFQLAIPVLMWLIAEGKRLKKRE